MKGVKVGLIGCGAIGRTLGKGILEGKAGRTELAAICDIDENRLNTLYSELGVPEIKRYGDPADMIKSKDISLVVEAANAHVVELYAEAALRADKDVMLMSVGALSDQALYQRLKETAEAHGVKLYIPSGAICGLDGVKSASVEQLSRVEITTTKHPRSLSGAPYLEEHGIDLDSIKSPTVVFEGFARDAIKGFPKNVNVAVGLSLAGVGVDETRVKIIADPEAKGTRHEVRAVGDFGELYTVVNNRLHPDNPKTSYLAALSAIRVLRRLSEPIQVGT